MPKGKLIISCGTPGSGKSTFLNKVFKGAPNTIIVSRDEIRFRLLRPHDSYFAREKEVWAEYCATIQKYLDLGYVVIADSTNLNASARHKLRSALKLGGVSVAVFYFDVPLDICLERNDLRRGTKAYVPEDKLCQMYHSSHLPRFNEGFSDVIVIDENGEMRRMKL